MRAEEEKVAQAVLTNLKPVLMENSCRNIVLITVALQVLAEIFRLRLYRRLWSTSIDHWARKFLGITFRTLYIWI